MDEFEDAEACSSVRGEEGGEVEKRFTKRGSNVEDGGGGGEGEGGHRSRWSQHRR